MSGDRSDTDPDADGMPTTRVERCENCDQETLHEVYVHVFIESAEEDSAGHSRQPYRVTVCTSCGTETLRRTNVN